MTNEEIIDLFEQWLFEQNLAQSSCLSYKLDIRIFLKNYEGKLFQGFIDKYHSEQFINQNSISLSTQKRRYVSLRKFYEFTKEHPVITMDNSFSINSSNPRQEVMLSDVEILSPEEIDMLLELPVTLSFKQYRDKAIFETIYSTGIRLNEMINITMKDIDEVLGYISFNRNHSRVTIPINKKYNPALMDYIDRYKKTSKSDKDFLFPNRINGRISRQSIWKIISSYTKKLFPEKKITPYGLRKSFAIHMFRNGASYEHISNIFGVKDISFLLDQNKQNDKYGDFYRFHPLNKRSVE